MSHTMTRAEAYALARQYLPGAVDFARRLMQTPSLPGEEGAVAALVLGEMKRLGFADVFADHAGNAVGVVRGRPGGKRLLLNAHLDHVDAGDPARWPYPPYAAELHDGYLWGRAASDIKGPLAVQVYAMAAVKQAGIVPAGDVLFGGVVMEEIGGLGTLELMKSVPVDWAIVGEATGNRLARGHRGRMEAILTVKGRSVHASVPEMGVNPHYSIARFLQALERLPMRSHPALGASSVAPTLYISDQRSANVVPGEIALHLDWRNVAGESADDVLAALRPLAEQTVAPEAEWRLHIEQKLLRSYTGFERDLLTSHQSYLLAEEHPLLAQSQVILAAVYGAPVPVDIWRFATDGGRLMAGGVPTIGFSAGDESAVHTVQERISLAMMEDSLAGHIALLAGLGQENGGA